MAIKRSWEDDREIENLAMANCLMLLSRVGQSDSLPGRVFHCKTCNKGFKSFQALGGHRASHKRPRTTAADGGGEVQTPVKVMKTHECSVCGVEFALGQALGGHMRRHRNGGDEKSTGRREVVVVPRRETVVVGRGFGLGLGLDLNLTPDENGLRFWSREVNTALAM